MNQRDTYNEPMEENNLPDALRVTPFSTNEDFFAKQEELIRAEIKIGIQRSSLESSGYTVPEGYFGQLKESIFLKESEQKLKEQVATLSYQVPENYFESLEDSIRIKISEINLKESVVQSGFTVPTDYFATLENRITAQRSEEFLRSKVTTDGYLTPADYFQSLTGKITSKISADGEDEGVKIIAINRERSLSSYISAAAVLFLIGFGSYFALKQTPSSDATPNLQTSTSKINVSDVSDEEILEYLAQVSEGEELIHLTKFVEQEKTSQDHIDNSIDDEDIKEYLNYML
ncbi:hypothetical protein [Sphingobacterium tabacisoli]|uniref:CCDC81-like prokaryotic HU domain-containing protein n=1 Tax=Sphingobacterium tabacisoli TaxID=2044855 RepID=A0ABW5KXJ0_9SPHI|nr:hypothetical protein [Sphingobacterium tabacisoli]